MVLTEGPFPTSAMSTRPISTISPAQLGDSLPACLVVDVRAYSAFRAGHIAGAAHANIAQIMIDRLAKGLDSVFSLVTGKHRAMFKEEHLAKPIVIVCDQNPEQQLLLAGNSPVSLFCNALVALGCNVALLVDGYPAFSGLCPGLTETGPEVKVPALSPIQLSSIEKKKRTAASPYLSSQPVIRGPSKIEENLFLGCYEDSLNQAKLTELGVTHIINVTADLPNSFEGHPGRTYMRIPVNDTFAQQISDYFAPALAFIDAAHASGGVVFVHCMAGISRSATVILAYLMTKTGLTCEEALASLREKRSIVSPNLDFMGALMRLEKQLRVAV